MSLEPEIKYALTEDNVSIAYFTVGEGDPPIVAVDAMYSNVKAEWDDPRQRAQYEAAARVTTLVRYDHRGFGLSDRDPADLSPDGLMRDIETVVERVLPNRPFVLFAIRGMATAIAVTYAARHPERLTHLALWYPMARLPAILVERLQAIIDSPGADERFVSESVVRVMQGWDDHDASQALAALMRASTSTQGFKRWLDAARHWDVRALLPSVTTATLLLPYGDHPIYGVSSAREISASLPNSEMVIIDGATSAERNAQTIIALGKFIQSSAPPARAASLDQAASAMSASIIARGGSTSAVILFTDIADSTALTERLGDARFRDASRALDAGLRAAIRDAGGAAVDGKLLGDGVLATFPSAAQAIDGARRCLALSAASELGLHIGLHAGDVIREQDNVFGGAVNIAARICALSAPGEILVSDVVRGMARTSAGVAFDDRGEQAMKGVGEPVRVYVVRGQP